MIRKADIVKDIVEEFKLTKTKATFIFDFIIDEMKLELMKGSDVVIPQFITLSVKDTMWRTVIVPSTGDLSSAKKYKRLKCKFSKKFRDQVKWSIPI